MILTFRGLFAVIYLTNYDILTERLAEDATIVGYVNTNTTLICDKEFYNYPGWNGPDGITYTYVFDEMINPACSRLVWASNKRDMVIRETNMTDAGVHTCSTPNSRLYIIQLVVRVPPDPPEIQNKVGSTVGGIEDRILTLTCISREGKPAPYLNWYRGTTKLTSTKTVTDQSDGTTTVTIASSFTATRSLDKTNYTCKSSFDPPDWPLSTHVMLFLSLKPSYPVINGTATVTENNKVHLQCRSTGCRPEGNMSWTFDGQTIVTNTLNTPVSDMFTITSDFLSRPLDRADNGKSVICRVGHESLTSFRTVRQYLHVQFAPTSIVLTGNQQIVANGQNKLTLSCTTDSAYPPATVTWWNHSSQITEGNSQAILSGNYGGNITVGRLEIKPTRAMDGDSISCRGSNSAGPSNPPRDRVVLNLNYTPITTIIGGSQRIVTEGDTSVSMDCRAESKPPAYFTWQRPGESSYITNGTGTADNNRLVYTIPSVNRNHAGIWRCTAYNGIPISSDSSEQQLIVYYPPDITVSTINTTTNVTDHFINCSASGVPSNYDFTTWTQKWSETKVIIRDKLTSSGESSPSTQYLHFSSLSYQDTGEYICGAGNGVKNLISTGTVYFLVKAAPVVTKFSNVTHAKNTVHKVQAFLNKRVSIHSTVYSNAGAIVTNIFKLLFNSLIDVNGAIIKPAKTTAKLNVYSHVVETDDAYELTIYHTIKSPEEFGKFVLYFTNDVGTTTLKFEITSEGPPETPKDFATLQGSETSSSIRFSWFPGFHGDADQTFHIEYRSEGHEWQEGVRVFGGKVLQQQLQIDVNGLESGSSYLFRIYASNIYGNSDKSLELLGRTIKEKPSNDNTASVAGWSTAAVLGILLTVIGVLFLLHRNKRLPVCRKTQNRTETREVAFSDLKTKSKTETYSMSSGTPASTLEGHSNDRYSGNVNDELDPEKDATHLYSMINEGATQPNQRHENNAGYSGNVYDELDPEKEATHLYSMRHGDTEQPKQRQENNQGSDKKTYANTPASKIFPKSVDDCKKSMPGEGDSQALTYSNLNLMP